MSIIHNMGTPSSSVIIYVDCNYSGASQAIGYGNYSNIPSPVGNKSISAIKVPPGITVQLYENPNFSGAMWQIQGPANMDCFWTSNRIWNDRAASMKVLPSTAFSPPTPAKIGDCTLVPDFDFYGNDINNAPTGSVEECASRCSQNTNCKGFARRNSDGMCWIKTKTENKRPDTNFISGICQKTCGQQVNVVVPYNIGNKTLENCKEYKMDSSTHTVDFKINEANGIEVISAVPFCGKTENVSLDHGLGTKQLQRCQTYTFNGPTGTVTVTVNQDGSVKYGDVQTYGTPINDQKRLEYQNTQYCYITSPFYNRQVSGRQDDSVIVIQNRLAWERWKISPAQYNQVYIENNNFKGKYLNCLPDGTINMTSQKGPSSTWVLLKGIGQFNTAHNQCVIRSAMYPFVLSTDGQRVSNVNGTAKGVAFNAGSFDRMVWDIAPYDQLRLVWSNNGPVGGMLALKVTNPSTNTTLGNVWNQTYLCYSHEIGLVWALNDDDKNKLVANGYKATQIAEGAEPQQNQWMNKWLCVPSASFVDLQWTSSDVGRDQLIAKGYDIVKWDVPGDPYTWSDNYLGYKLNKKVYDSNQVLPYVLEVQAGGWNTGWCKSQPQSNQFFQANVNGRLIMSKTGQPLAASGRGLNLCAFDKNLQPLLTKSYDTHAIPQDSDNFTNDAGQLLKNTNVKLIIVGTTDEPVNQLKNSVNIFMASQFGANYFSYLEYRGSYLLLFDNTNKKIIYEAMNNCDMVRFSSKCNIFCAPIFNPEWYISHYPDLQKAFGNPQSPDAQKKARDHWQTFGQKEGRQASPTFFMKDYMELYPDVQKAVGNNTEQAVQHYINIGLPQGRRGVIFDVQTNKYGLISNNLQCYLDARQTDSYSGQGNSWKDISGNNRNFQWNTTPQYNDGRFKYINTAQATGPASNSFGFGDGSNGGTVIVISRQRSMSQNRVFRFKEQPPGNYGFAVHQTWSNNITYFDNMGGAPVGQNRIYADVGNRWNQTCVWAYVRTISGQLQIYCNGQLLIATTDVATPLNLSNLPAVINEYSNWNADIAVFAVYNFGLLPRHIKAISDWWVTSEKTRKSERDIQMANKTKTMIKDFPVPMGLQCYLDASYLESYPGKGTVFTDLSPYGRNFNFQSQPTYLGNRISTQGNNKLTGPASNTFNIDENDNYTIVFYAKTNSLSTNSVFQFYGTNHVADRGIFCHPTWVDQTLYFDQAGCCSSNVRLTAPVQGYWNQLTVYALVKDDTGRHIYINGNKVSTTTDRGLIINLNQRPLDVLVTESYPVWNSELSAFMVYNNGLTAQDIQQLYRWLVSGYEFKEYSWNAANQYCIDQGQQLCSYRDYCPSGAMQQPIYKLPQTETWGPISDGVNQWVQLGDPQNLCKPYADACKSSNQPCGPDGKPTWGTQSNSGRRAILCCNPPKVQVYFDTIGQISDDTCIIFKDDVFMKYNIKSHLSTDVLNIKDLQMRGVFKEGKFQACLDYQDQHLLYIFKDSLVVKYDYTANRTADPISVNTIYPGLPSNYQRGNFDAILRLSQTQFAIFKGNQVLVYDENTHSVTNPQKITQYWPALTSIFTSGQITAFIRMSPQHTIIFKEDLYAVYLQNNIMKGPYNIVPNWRGLKVPFIRPPEECLIYGAQIDYLNKMKTKYDSTNPTPGKLNEIDRQIANYQKLLDQRCNFISYDEYLRDLEAKKNRLEVLKQKILDSKNSLASKKSQIEAANKQIARLNGEISKLKMMIDLEKQKTCPKDSTCALKSPFTSKLDNRRCSSQLLIELLKKSGIPETEIQKVQPYLDYQPGINNFPIKTHPQFYKYSKIPEVASCDGLTRQSSTNQSSPDLIGQILSRKDSQTNDRRQPLQPQSNAITDQMAQKEALDIFQKALLQYNMAVAKNEQQHEQNLNSWLSRAQQEANKLGLCLNPEQLKLFAISLQLNDNLRKSKKLSYQTTRLLKGIIDNPKYQQLLKEIDSLNLHLTFKKSQLDQQNQELMRYRELNLIEQIDEINRKNRALQLEISQIEQSIAQKSQSFETFI